jgi:chemotaxis protein methyltransferase CheR
MSQIHPIRSLTAQEFQQIRALARRESGLDLGEGKQQLVAARLGRMVRELRLGSFHEYYEHVVADATGEALIAMIDALTTNHTSFFREPTHFEFLRRTVIPEFRSRDRIAVWSAGCATGEEPYSIACCLLEELGPQAAGRIRILATDISTRVLGVARAAAYPAESFPGKRVERLRHFIQTDPKDSGRPYVVKAWVRTLVQLQRLNLMQDFSQVGRFPLIFCRNVMIYFDRSTQRDLIQRLSERLEPGGYLLIGHSESLGGIAQSLTYVQPAVYRRPAQSPRNSERERRAG